ncbi:L-ascorbate metabolism protein UlaG (beta-lactamase superfamily) [Flavobacterium sp. 90]|nr:L-ascorbate metabolism protein UlaG (beta-lactamase superfamily) [Flavobacterium sp. 81]TCK56705.1 L-ascorbate metabolism protein UlaG (beta-lactamase superfamily) [Flavobacterium sp. 90]
MITFFIIIFLLATITFLYLQLPQFGKNPSGKRLVEIEKSAHFKNDRFNNLVERPTLSEGYTMLGEMYNVVFKEYPRREPKDSLPSVKTDLKNIPPDSNALVWFGHSSVFMQLEGKKILIDPVFSGKASPLPWGVRAYNGSDIYSVADMPEIDYLFISHDHYDHLDYETIIGLKDKVKHVVCGLGVGAHFERWGYKPEQIIEKDWNQKIELDHNFTIFTESSHHESGRGFVRGKTLWMSYLIQTPSLKIYISGDGGFDDRFKKIGEKFGPIDWAILECGQYDKAWQSVHNLPEEVAQAAVDLGAKNMIPVHNSKFTLGKHAWDEPLEKITQLSLNKPYRLVTPMIGQEVDLNNNQQQFKRWWENVN